MRKTYEPQPLKDAAGTATLILKGVGPVIFTAGLLYLIFDKLIRP